LRDLDSLFDPDLFIVLLAQQQPLSTTLAKHVDDWAKTEPKRAEGYNFDRIEAAQSPLLSLPAGWQGHELVLSLADSLGGSQRYRVLVAGRSDPTGVVVVSLYAPESVMRAAPGFFTQLLTSVH
jgi:hypothetical protein